MNLKLGDKIKDLRKRNGRTQEALAEAVGVSCQAVSRWEKSLAYPEIEIIPSIANYFGISIDELFGYECERDKKVDKIIARIEAYGIKARSDSEWVDDCTMILREGLAEFPYNEKLMITLADVLAEAGWRVYGEHHYYDEDGYSRVDYSPSNFAKILWILQKIIKFLQRQCVFLFFYIVIWAIPKKRWNMHCVLQRLKIHAKYFLLHRQTERIKQNILEMHC